MITAAQAKQATMEKITQIAKEFILNQAEPVIDEFTKEGKFFAKVSFDGIYNSEVTGQEVVKLLEERGFEAEHVLYDGPNGYDNYILIKWG